jgi:hypothetical protein
VGNDPRAIGAAHYAQLRTGKPWREWSQIEICARGQQILLCVGPTVAVVVVAIGRDDEGVLGDDCGRARVTCRDARWGRGR